MTEPMFGGPSDDQGAEQELLSRARAHSGVAEVIEVYGPLSAYVRFFNVQPHQTRNATGANVD